MCSIHLQGKSLLCTAGFAAMLTPSRLVFSHPPWERVYSGLWGFVVVSTISKLHVQHLPHEEEFVIGCMALQCWHTPHHGIAMFVRLSVHMVDRYIWGKLWNIHKQLCLLDKTVKSGEQIYTRNVLESHTIEGAFCESFFNSARWVKKRHWYYQSLSKKQMFIKILLLWQCYKVAEAATCPGLSCHSAVSVIMQQAAHTPTNTQPRRATYNAIITTLTYSN